MTLRGLRQKGMLRNFTCDEYTEADMPDSNHDWWDDQEDAIGDSYVEENNLNDDLEEEEVPFGNYLGAKLGPDGRPEGTGKGFFPVTAEKQPGARFRGMTFLFTGRLFVSTPVERLPDPERRVRQPAAASPSESPRSSPSASSWSMT